MHGLLLAGTFMELCANVGINTNFNNSCKNVTVAKLLLLIVFAISGLLQWRTPLPGFPLLFIVVCFKKAVSMFVMTCSHIVISLCGPAYNNSVVVRKLLSKEGIPVLCSTWV